MDYKNSLIITSIKTIKKEGLKRFINHHLLFIIKFRLDYIKDTLIFKELKFDPIKKYLPTQQSQY